MIRRVNLPRPLPLSGQPSTNVTRVTSWPHPNSLGPGTRQRKPRCHRSRNGAPRRLRAPRPRANATPSHPPDDVAIRRARRDTERRAAVRLHRDTVRSTVVPMQVLFDGADFALLVGLGLVGVTAAVRAYLGKHGA
jgi:hypothetical protein